MRTKLTGKKLNTGDSMYENGFIVLVLLFWCRDSILPFLRAVLLLISTPVADMLIPVLFCFALIFAIPYILSKLRAADLIFFMAIACTYFLDYFLFPDNQNYLISYAFGFLATCVPLYFVGVSLDVPAISKKLYISSIISIWVNLVYFLFVRTSTYRAVTYGDMDAAYNMLPHVCWIACNLFDHPNVINISSFAIGGFLLFAMGSRGPMVCLLVLIVLYLFFFKKFKHPLITKISILLVAAAIILSFTPIVTWLSSVSKDLGLSTRVFDSISDDSFFVSLGRDQIRETLVNNLAQRPAIGFGFAGDRALLRGRYAHNLWIELCVSFGYPLGCLLFFALAGVLLCAIIKARPGEERAFALTLTCACVVKLMMSGSLLDEMGLYLLIGTSASIIRASQKDMTRRVPAFREVRSLSLKGRSRKNSDY